MPGDEKSDPWDEVPKWMRMAKWRTEQSFAQLARDQGLRSRATFAVTLV